MSLLRPPSKVREDLKLSAGVGAHALPLVHIDKENTLSQSDFPVVDAAALPSHQQQQQQVPMMATPSVPTQPTASSTRTTASTRCVQV